MDNRQNHFDCRLLSLSVRRFFERKFSSTPCTYAPCSRHFSGRLVLFFCKRRTACSSPHVQASQPKIFRPKKVPCFFFPNPKPSVFRSCNIGLEECTADSSNRAAAYSAGRWASRQAIFQLPSPNDMLCKWSDGHCHILQPSHALIGVTVKLKSELCRQRLKRRRIGANLFKGLNFSLRD